MKRYLTIPVLSALLLTACADNSPGGKAIHARQAHFKEIGGAFKDINGQLKDSAPDLAAIKEDATQIGGLAQRIKDWFPAGSGPQDGKRTDAKAEIWSQPAAFQQAATHLADAAAQLKDGAAFGNVAATRAGTKTLGLACKSCHDKFRKE